VTVPLKSRRVIARAGCLAGRKREQAMRWAHARERRPNDHLVGDVAAIPTRRPQIRDERRKEGPAIVARPRMGARVVCGAGNLRVEKVRWGGLHGHRGETRGAGWGSAPSIPRVCMGREEP
jgi:hypothetical protein